MTTTEELLDQYLADFDNYKNVEELGDPNRNTSGIKGNQILNMPRWAKLASFDFDEVLLKGYFGCLNEEECLLYFSFGIECMLNFVQANFTGPDLPKLFDTLFDEAIFEGVDFKKWLALNNEDINVNTKYPGLLCSAITIFKCCDVNVVLNLWWQWRALMVHQHILEELSPTLLSQADKLQREIRDLQLEGRRRAQFEIEQAQLYHLFRNIHKSEEHIAVARNILGINYELVGKLGKRTKFQQNDLAQLTLHVTVRKDDNLQHLPVHEFEVPTNLALQDDVRLDTIKFAEDANRDMIIPDLEQKLLVAVVQGMLISKPQDDLFYEEVKPFLDLILSQNNTWAVRATVLLLRSKLESKNKRTIERCILQCEEVVNSRSRFMPNSMNRVGGIYCTNLQPFWKSEALLAELMLNLGMVKASLDLYLKLELWEEVIVCYTILKLRHKAAEIIKQRLEAQPTAKLWCLLGDATDDVSCYEKAWEFSKKRSSRAQRHWGQFLFSRKQYQQCIPHFEKSLSINPLQANVWLNYGYAALDTENWQTAATAYRRYTYLEPGNFEAWNNLAKSYIKLGNKRGAHQALHDALRCNYDNWKVWDNLMVVSADIANFSDVILAYHRILDLKEKHLDIEVLGALVYGVCNNINDQEGRPANRLMHKTRELLGRITSLYPTEGHVWELYASLAPVLLLRAQRLQRALRGFSQSGWEKNPLKCQQVLYVCHKLAEVALSDQIEPTDSLINTVKLSLTSFITTIKKQDFEETRNLLDEVSELLAQVVQKVKSGINAKSENKE